MKKVIFLLVFYISFYAYGKCTDSIGEGEATVLNGDIASAKAEAFARAKWNAVEKVLGIYTSVKTVISNFKLLDEVIKNEVGGFIKDVKILENKLLGDTVYVKVKGCVYPKEAEKAISTISQDTKFSVLFIANGSDINPISSRIIDILIENRYKVYELTENPDINYYNIERAIKNRRFFEIKNLLSRYLSGALIFGTIDVIPIAKQGQDIGYGISSPFEVIKVQGIYYFLIPEKGRVRILSSKVLQATGRGLTKEQAINNALSIISDEVAEKIVEDIDKYRALKKKIITVIVKNAENTQDNFRVKEIIQRIPWVEKVDDVGIGKFRVTYLEKSIYFANALERNPQIKLVEFSPTEVIIEVVR